MKSRIMYIERKDNGLSGPARIGRVTFSQTGRTIYYRGMSFQAIKGFKANYQDVATGEKYWISGCKKDGNDTLYGGGVTIDEDVREEYWVGIRKLPARRSSGTVRDLGKYRV